MGWAPDQAESSGLRSASWQHTEALLKSTSAPSPWRSGDLPIQLDQAASSRSRAIYTTCEGSCISASTGRCQGAVVSAGV